MASERKKCVLISAYACEPNRGSEPGVGWNIALSLTDFFDVVVITRANNREVIESSEDLRATRVKWIYLDLPYYLRFWKRGAITTGIYYLLWQRLMIHAAKRYVKQGGNVDVSYHLTFGNFLPATLLSKLGVPWVIGPVGGGERAPRGLALRARLKGSLVYSWKSFLLRKGITQKVYTEAAKVFAANSLTKSLLEKIGAHNVSVLPQSGVGGDEVSHFIEGRELDEIREGDKSVRLVTACRLVDWKAVDLAIEAFATAQNRGLSLELTILNTGEELRGLKSLTEKLRISDKVHFLGALPSLEDVYHEVQKSDALLHPAVSEAFGQICLESLALGTPVICLDWAGPGLIVDKICGYPVPTSDNVSRREIIEGLADGIEWISRNRRSDALKKSCQKRAENFRWSTIVKVIAEELSLAANKRIQN